MFRSGLASFQEHSKPLGGSNSTLDSMFFGQIHGLFQSPVELSGLLDELNLGVLVLDLNRRILFMNSAFELLSGFSREDIRYIPCRHVLRTNICGRNCPVIQAEQNNAPVTVEGNIINRDRQKLSVRVTGAPLHGPQGLIGFLETVENITPTPDLHDGMPRTDTPSGFIGRSAKMKQLLKLVPVVAQTDSSLLITGETGTGKDFLAEVIHNASDRSQGAFIKINCGALPETLLESELFGHKKGAFTGAVSDKMGRLRLAHNGTLFLTEIGDLTLPLQVKLLTYLDDKVVYPLGGADGFQSDVRIMAATHRNLERMVKEGRFRQDLLFRLNVVRLSLPPLRERHEDIVLLMDHFLKTYSARFGKWIKDVSPRVRTFLFSYTYPGNVRELKNIIEYATSICPSDTIGVDHLPAYLTEEKPADDFDDDTMTGAEPQAPSGSVPIQTKGMNWTDIERQVIVDALVKAKGRKSKAAEALGWGRTTLWRKMKRYGLDS